MWVSSSIEVNPVTAGNPLYIKEVGNSVSIQNLQVSGGCCYGARGTMRDKGKKGEILDSECLRRQPEASGQVSRVSQCINLRDLNAYFPDKSHFNFLKNGSL